VPVLGQTQLRCDGCPDYECLEPGSAAGVRARIQRSAEREPSEPHTRILDNDQCARFEFAGKALDHVKNPWRHGIRALIASSDEYDAREFLTGRGQEVTEVEIERDDDPGLIPRMREDVGIEQPVVAGIPRVNDIVAAVAKGDYRQLGDAHVGEELQAPRPVPVAGNVSSLARNDAYLRACSTSAGSRSGYSARICGVVIPFATRLTTSDTVIRIPRRQARPPMTPGVKVIRSNIVVPSVETSLPAAKTGLSNMYGVTNGMSPDAEKHRDSIIPTDALRV